jgi:hypothetical protein
MNVTGIQLQMNCSNLSGTLPLTAHGMAWLEGEEALRKGTKQGTESSSMWIMD